MQTAVSNGNMFSWQQAFFPEMLLFVSLPPQSQTDRLPLFPIHWPHLRWPLLDVAEVPVQRVAAAFARRVLAMPGVRAVVLDTTDPEVRITTFIDKRDPDLRSRIYAVEFEVLGRFGSFTADFRVRSLDTPGSQIPEHLPIGGVRVFGRGA